jgi:hypothetical protein
VVVIQLAMLLTMAAPAAAQPVPSPSRPVWAAEVSVDGGITGTGAGRITVDSDGHSTCAVPMRCGDRADSRAMASIHAAIARLRSADWRQPTDAPRCFDCYVTTLRVRLRGSGGGETVRTYSWTAVSFEMVPDDAKEMYRAIVALGVGGK